MSKKLVSAQELLLRLSDTAASVLSDYVAVKSIPNYSMKDANWVSIDNLKKCLDDIAQWLRLTQ